MNRSTPLVAEPWQRFVGPNLGYVIEQYEKFQENPNEVDEELRSFFEKWGPPPEPLILHNENQFVSMPVQTSTASIEKYAAIIKLVEHIRTNGHMHASIYAIEENKKQPKPLLDLDKYRLTEQDLKNIPVNVISSNLPANIQNGLDAIHYLVKAYTGAITFEFYHLLNEDEQEWLTHMVESGAFIKPLTSEKRKALLNRLSEVEGFEHFIHKTYVGQKRFSIEGLDMLVPLLDEIIDQAVGNGTSNVNIGMAHRGRLNVLAHVLRKPYEIVFSEFQHAPNKDLVPSEGSSGVTYGWSGDVKYHLGADRKIKKENTQAVHLTLGNNPSHLEFVDPIVIGVTRAGQDDRNKPGFPEQNEDGNMAILIHGDAAFIGEGIVTETLNLANLRGYHTGGTVHIIGNNRVGFTTVSRDSRSTKYASDLAKGFEMPIIRVNADNPEAVLSAAHLAFEYRKQFHKDILIDLVGYRRYGHNEMDEPAATQPLMYEKIRKHKTVRDLYATQMKDAGIVTEEEDQNYKKQVEKILRDANDKVTEQKNKNIEPDVVQTNQPISKHQTGVSTEVLAKINDEIMQFPDSFNVFPKLKRIYARRSDMFTKEGKADWSLGEAFAFASILRDGTPIRISGQDSERGTFAHRHLVLHDAKTGEEYSPLHQLSDVNVSFAIHNSPLSEGSVLGFEYGYNVFAKDTLTIWEAQFGDFANTAQVIIDQFIASGQAKWGQQSGLVMLLPHAYEGQGPEHSSGRMERFLQLSAENNWIVANVTSAAQYFHLLRRQAALLGTDEIRPLVLMSPKSLLRSPYTISDVADFAEGSFEPLIDVKGLGGNVEKVERLVLCSGKITSEIAQKALEQEANDWFHVLSVEEIYPFPKDELFTMLFKYKNVKEIVWVQEEPMNMGAWNFVEPRLREIAGKNIKVRYIGRKRMSSPAEGDPTVHKKEQERIITESLSK